MTAGLLMLFWMQATGINEGMVPPLQLTGPAKISLRAQRGEFEVRGIVGESFRQSDRTTTHTINYRRLCVTPCELVGPLGRLDLWVVAPSGGYTAGRTTINLAPGENKYVIRPGSNALFTTGMFGLILGGVVGLIGTVGYLKDPGTMHVLAPSGDYEDQAKERSSGLLTAALVGWGAALAGAGLAIASDTWITRE